MIVNKWYSFFTALSLDLLCWNLSSKQRLATVTAVFLSDDKLDHNFYPLFKGKRWAPWRAVCNQCSTTLSLQVHKSSFHFVMNLSKTMSFVVSLFFHILNIVLTVSASELITWILLPQETTFARDLGSWREVNFASDAVPTLQSCMKWPVIWELTPNPSKA